MVELFASGCVVRIILRLAHACGKSIDHGYERVADLADAPPVRAQGRQGAPV